MRILIAGGTGLIGQTLIDFWRGAHEITVLGRNKDKLLPLASKVRLVTWDELFTIDAHGFDVVINLCGRNISDKRWSEQIKADIIDSRVNTTHQLIHWLTLQKATPRYFSASAVGIYGLQPEMNQMYDESSPIAWDGLTHDFLSTVAIAWEKALKPAFDAAIPVTVLRFGVVLKRGHGFLKKLAPSFQCGLGAVIGEGAQPMSWIHHQDLASAVDFLINHPNLTGPFNLCSPHPITQKAFAMSYARALKRPLWLTLPKRVIKLLFGQMGDELINQGQAVLPSKLTAAGFEFKYPRIDDALSKESI